MSTPDPVDLWKVFPDLPWPRAAQARLLRIPFAPRQRTVPYRPLPFVVVSNLNRRPRR